MMSRRGERSKYLQGIRRAEQDGLIAYACNVHNKSVRRTRLSDEYSHLFDGGGELLSLKYTNTRPLSFVARQHRLIFTERLRRAISGIGARRRRCVRRSHCLLPDADNRYRLVTPLNPYLRFRRNDFYECTAESCLQERDLFYFFDVCSAPFVCNQYIGHFPSDISLPKESYHFIYENYGAIFYNFHPKDNAEQTELARASISSALSLLRRNGTMLIMASDGSYKMEEALKSITIDTDVIVTCRKTTACYIFPCIVAREESPLSKRLRDDKSSGAGKVLQLEFEAWQHVISEICCLPL